MAFDKATRNRLASFVGKARDLIADEFTQQFQSLYGISDKGTITQVDQLGHLDDMGLAIASLLRERIDYLLKTHPNDRDGIKEAVARLAREQAFTVLNRLAAIRMAEKRGIIVESVGKGYQSKGFKVFEQVAGAGLGDTYFRYCRYLYCLFDELAVDLGILFDRRSPQGLLFPRETALQALLALLNASDLDPLWGEDETIGWIYQYYNDPAERKKMRDESAAPRNSRELAVRNQFFTPRYVVEFLTDNTLGRIWYEMTQGQTSLKDSCRYLVKRPDEVFFHDKCSPSDAAAKRWLTGEEGDVPRADDLAYTVDGYSRHSSVEAASDWLYENIARVSAGDTEGFKTQELLDLLFLLHRADRFSEGTLDHYATEIKRIIETLGKRRALGEAKSHSQEELLNQQVYIPYRAIKDPRELRMLDPACGSMHFGLYAFDLLAVIYEEAWDKELESLRRDYPKKEVFLPEVPRLIIENNIHGIDIDPRTVQIASLSLWLRAQKSWHAQRVPAAQRPRIIRSNIVCAEPMPGSTEMLKEFTATLHPPLLGQLVEKVFDQMQLAGEAGSLLKIEEEIATLVKEAKILWRARPKAEQMELNLGLEAKPKQGEFPLDTSGISDERFWENFEESIYAALRDYATQAETGGYQRRLFAEDAARGFAFIDLCRKRYDAVVMNPPFGASAEKAKVWMRNTYPLCAENLLISFIFRFKAILASMGLLGCITDRSWLQKYDYRKFRVWVINQKCLKFAIDLGWGVLDAANVETAVSIFSNREIDAIVFGNAGSAPEGQKLGFPFPNSFIHSPRFFEVIPNYSFSYSIDPVIYAWFKTTLKVESKLVVFQGGIASWDTFQTIRCFWEASPDSIGLNCRWAFVQSGSPYAPYYYPTAMLTLCEEGKFDVILSNPTASTPGRWFYGRPGVAFGKRTDSMYTYAMPAGGAFSWEGQAGFALEDNTQNLYQILGFTNSSTYIGLANLVAGQHKYGGYLNTICCDVEKIPDVSSIVKSIVEELISWDQANECSPRFVCTGIFSPLDFGKPFRQRHETFTAKKSILFEKHTQVSNGVACSLGAMGFFDQLPESKSFETIFGHEFNNDFTAALALSYTLGIALGRWDIRFAIGARQPPALPDPFAPLTVCPPGMLQNAKGLPVEPKDVPADYPLHIPWPGILIDDENHPDDIVARVREVLEVIWKDRADAVEQEACELLGVKTMREYFRRPAGFFADHLKRYSKSRRQAPIYWPLSSIKGSYTLWIYYHRLTDQTLHTALADFVDPKLKSVRAEISVLRESGNQRNHLEELLDLEKELSDFHSEIERIIKLPWKPNLNDGVLITASPLWKLFRLPKWQKDLKACWEKLEKGEYDWANLAYSIWPDRVEKVCKKDRSIAIAHNMEHLCQVTPPKPKAKRAKKGS